MFRLMATWGRNRFARNTLHEVKPMPCIVIGDPLPPPEPDHAPFLLERKAFKVLLPTKRDQHGRYTWTPATFAPPTHHQGVHVIHWSVLLLAAIFATGWTLAILAAGETPP